MPNTLLKPDVLSLLVCDQILIDRLTGKTSLIGMFSTIGAPQYPVRHPQLCVFASLTDGRGKTNLRIRLVSVDEDDILGQADMEVDFKDPRTVFEIALAVGNVTFPKPGEYRLQLFADSSLLTERRIVVVQIGGTSDE